MKSLQAWPVGCEWARCTVFTPIRSGISERAQVESLLKDLKG